MPPGCSRARGRTVDEPGDQTFAVSRFHRIETGQWASSAWPDCRFCSAMAMTSGTHAAHPFGRDPALISEAGACPAGIACSLPTHTDAAATPTHAPHPAWGNDMGQLFFFQVLFCALLCLPNTARARPAVDPHSSGNERALNGDLPRELSRQGPKVVMAPLWLSFFIYLRSRPTFHRCSSLPFTLQTVLSCAAFNGTPPSPQHPNGPALPVGTDPLEH